MFSPRSLWKRCVHYGSPFRVLRCFFMRVIHPIAFFKRRRMARQRIAALSPEQRERMRVMQLEGCSPAGADQDSALLEQVCSTLRDRARTTPVNEEAGKGKNFWAHLLTEGDRTNTSPFLRLALQPSVLGMASAYFGEFPYLAGIEVYLSHGTHNAQWQESQLWHRDYDDRKMFKLFVYCSDVVDEKDGEFTYIPRSISQHVRNFFFPKRISDEEMTRQGHIGEERHIKGPAGTCFYIDTRHCYHLGSRVALGHTRLAFTASYVTFASLQPFDNRVNIVPPVTETEQMVLRA